MRKPRNMHKMHNDGHYMREVHRWAITPAPRHRTPKNPMKPMRPAIWQLEKGKYSMPRCANHNGGLPHHGVSITGDTLHMAFLLLRMTNNKKRG